MATRSIIKVEGNEAALYKHWDGYPSATLPWLIEFFKGFYSKRGNDNDYCLAQLIRSSITMAEKFNLPTDTETGWGVMPKDTECWAEYVYELCQNGSIKVNGKVVWKHGAKALTAKQIENIEG